MSWRERIAKAKRERTARAKTDDVLALRKGGMGATQIAKQLGIGRNSIYRIQADA